MTKATRSEDARRRARQSAATVVRRLSATAATAVTGATQDASAVDLVVASVLARPDLPPLNDAPAFVRFLRDALRTDRRTVSVLREDPTPGDGPGLWFAGLLADLTVRVPPLTLASATRLGLVADALSARREPFDRPRFSGDVGLHAGLASSFARKGRLLAALVRYGRVTTAFEIGTAYGMSALFLAAALPLDGRVGTVECSHPQLDVARPLLADEEPTRVVTYEGLSGEVADAVRRDLGRLDLLFHDGAHSRDAYVEDFATYEPLLAPGALVLYDDIRWEDARWGDGSTQTYAGWREVAAHPRVRAAAEIDDAYGLLLLS